MTRWIVIALLTLIHRISLLPLVARPMFGFPGDPAEALRHGTSRSPVPSGSDRPPRTPQPSLVCSPLLRLAREDTASQCSHAGIHFCPLVLEAVGGGWSEALRSVVSWIASESNRNSSVSHSDTSFKIAQRISCALHRENARAILKRAPEQAMSPCSSLSLSLLSESAP